MKIVYDFLRETSIALLERSSRHDEKFSRKKENLFGRNYTMNFCFKFLMTYSCLGQIFRPENPDWNCKLLFLSLTYGLNDINN